MEGLRTIGAMFMPRCHGVFFANADGPRTSSPATRTRRRVGRDGDVGAPLVDSAVVAALRLRRLKTVEFHQPLALHPFDYQVASCVAEGAEVFRKYYPVHTSNCRDASPPRLNHDLHTIDATPARWRGQVSHHSMVSGAPDSGCCGYYRSELTHPEPSSYCFGCHFIEDADVDDLNIECIFAFDGGISRSPGRAAAAEYAVLLSCRGSTIDIVERGVPVVFIEILRTVCSSNGFEPCVADRAAITTTLFLAAVTFKTYMSTLYPLPPLPERERFLLWDECCHYVGVHDRLGRHLVRQRREYARLSGDTVLVKV